MLGILVGDNVICGFVGLFQQDTHHIWLSPDSEGEAGYLGTNGVHASRPLLYFGRIYNE